MAGNPGNVSTENINDVILRLLKLKPGTDLDYQTYFDILKKKLASHRLAGKELPLEEQDLLEKELKRVWKIKDRGARFTIKEKTTKTSAAPPSPGDPIGGPGGPGNPFKTSAIVKAPPAGKITAEKLFRNPRVEQVSVKDVTEKTAKVSKKSDPLENINKTLDSILKTLTDIDKEDRKSKERQRVDAERRQREGKERGMESRSFEGLKKAISAVTKPFQSIFDRIINFIFYTLLGRAVMKLLDWFGDPKNQGKIQSIVRFFSDHWPTLLALYLRFGTGLGRFIGRLGGVLIKGAFKLGALAAKLLLKAGVGKAGGKLSKVAGFLGGKRGKALATVLGIGADVAVTAGTSVAIDKIAGGGGEGTQKFSGGGAVRVPRFAGGGFANFGKMFGSAAMGAGMGSMFGPMGMLLGAGIGGAAGSGMFGLVNGPKGKDKVPAMLTDGEFVMSTGAVQKYGVDTLEAMNAAGGGTNQPKVVGGKTYAYGGGRVGDDGGRRSSDDDLKGLINRFFRGSSGNKGFDIGNPRTWNNTNSSSPSRSRTPTGSLMTDPLGAISRMTGIGVPKSGGSSVTNRPSSLTGSSPSRSRTPTGSLMTDPLGAISRMTGIGRGGSSGSQRSGSPSSGPKSGGTPSKNKGFFQEIQEKLTGSGASTYRDAGSIYAKQMLGGMDGPVSEMDLGKESKQELQKAIQRAKKRTGFQIKRVESEIAKLKAMGAKDGNPALERQKSFLSKLKSGGIRVEYADYADEKGNMSESTKNAKKILGQFWAYGRNKKEGGGYRIEDKYDFDTFKKKVKDPKTGKMVEKDLDQGELIRDVILGKGKDTQQRLQAAYLLNPFKGKGDVDMVLGGKRTAAESVGLAGSKTLLGGMLGMSGKPKDKNTQALEAKRPWWDKMGLFGGRSAQIKRDKTERQEFLKRNPKATLYGPNDPRRKNTGQPYKSRFARPKTTAKPPVKPPVKPKPKVVRTPTYQNTGGYGRYAPPFIQRAPSPSPRHSRGTGTTARTQGVKR